MENTILKPADWIDKFGDTIEYGDDEGLMKAYGDYLLETHLKAIIEEVKEKAEVSSSYIDPITRRYFVDKQSIDEVLTNYLNKLK